MENNTLVTLKAAITGARAVLTSLWGWFGWMVFVWVGLMLADWLVGSAAAMKAGKWSSAKLREGAWHKGGMVIIWYILGELGSLAEHAVSMGAKVPSWLPRILDISKDAVDAAAEAIAHETTHDVVDHEKHE